MLCMHQICTSSKKFSFFKMSILKNNCSEQGGDISREMDLFRNTYIKYLYDEQQQLGKALGAFHMKLCDWSDKRNGP